MTMKCVGVPTEGATAGAMTQTLVTTAQVSKSGVEDDAETGAQNG